MTFRFTEARDSRAMTADPPSFAYRFHASGSPDPAYVNAYTLASTPAIVNTTWGILYRADVRLTWTGFELCDVEVPYTSRETPQGSYRLSYDTTGGSTHIKFSKESVNSYGNAPPDFKQLIGVNDNQVEGADIVVPALRITVNFSHPLGIVTLPRIKQVAQITGMVNSASFLTFAAGEVLFLGSTGDEGSDTPTTAAYHFAMSQNAQGLSIGDIANIAKKGWELVWVRWQDKIDTNALVKQPEAVYVERVYDTADLAAVLGFG